MGLGLAGFQGKADSFLKFSSRRFLLIVKIPSEINE